MRLREESLTFCLAHSTQEPGCPGSQEGSEYLQVLTEDLRHNGTNPKQTFYFIKNHVVPHFKCILQSNRGRVI